MWIYFYNKKIKDTSLSHNVTKSDYDKCEIYVESKSINKSDKSVYRESELPELIHRNHNEMKNNIIRGGKYSIPLLLINILDHVENNVS